jgi:hypothetical protein
MANRISHASGPNEGRESNQTLASQSIFGRIRSAYEREMTTVDPQSDLPLRNRGGDPAAIRARPRTYPALAVGPIVGGRLVSLLSGTGSGPGLSAAVDNRWDSLIPLAIGLGLLYGVWCLFWPILRNAILMIVGWIIILGIGGYTFLKYIGYCPLPAEELSHSSRLNRYEPGAMLHAAIRGAPRRPLVWVCFAPNRGSVPTRRTRFCATSSQAGLCRGSAISE